jgi:signal transduction histidine kinase/CheY-like chemotaxis protein
MRSAVPVQTGVQDPLRDMVRAEQVRLLYADGGMALASTFLVAALLAGVLVWQHALALAPAFVWLGFMALHTAVRGGVRRAYLKAEPPVEDWWRWAKLFVAGTVAGGLVWGVGALWLLPPDRFDLQMLVLALLSVGTYGIIGAAGAYLPAFYSFVAPFPPVIVWLLARGDGLHIACAVTILLWLPTVAVLGRRYNASLAEALRLRFENAALADGLLAQKQVAEQSNVAKSRFLAAASHDLRQPVHALGMLLGALRGLDLTPKAARLAEHMDSSISGLDGLFTALLDVSRLDAGVIESKPVVVALQPLLARIRRDLAGAAEAKGIALVMAPTRASVRSDPVLLERVLRNLIGNAVRYTDEGRVLVTCRRCSGDISLEVWDTGRGIAAEQQEAIFEEFYQVAGKTSGGGAGLGLGLAIVRRLTGILNHPLSLRSAPGRGSVFRLLIPRIAAPQDVAADLADAMGPADPSSALILAIDDDAVVRTAMGELLISWGHRVVAAADTKAALAMLKTSATPDLIVCDYRLGRGETGLDAIDRLRAATGVRIPAILLTGETSPEKLRAALASGHPLLHKPLAPGRLRAEVTMLLSGSGKACAVAAE